MALNSFNLGNEVIAQEQVLNTMRMFDGIGFQDKAFNGAYETYKLALAIYVAQIVNIDMKDGDKILEILLKMQDTSGGFHTHYDENFNPMGDTNTETTSFALLAIHSVAFR